jgi:hypothetical protein
MATDGSNASWIEGGPRAAEVLRQAVLLKRWYVWMYSTTFCLAHLADGRIAGILHLGPPRIARAGSVHFAAGCLVASEAGALSWISNRAALGFADAFVPSGIDTGTT